MSNLETAVVKTLSEFGVRGFTTKNTGVWVDHPTKGESKICAIGEWSLVKQDSQKSLTPQVFRLAMGSAIMGWHSTAAQTSLGSSISHLVAWKERMSHLSLKSAREQFNHTTWRLT